MKNIVKNGGGQAAPANSAEFGLAVARSRELLRHALNDLKQAIDFLGDTDPTTVIPNELSRNLWHQVRPIEEALSEAVAMLAHFDRPEFEDAFDQVFAAQTLPPATVRPEEDIRKERLEHYANSRLHQFRQIDCWHVGPDWNDCVICPDKEGDALTGAYGHDLRMSDETLTVRIQIHATATQETAIRQMRKAIQWMEGDAFWDVRDVEDLF